MEKIIKIDSVECYNNLFGLETLHPLVSVVDFRNATRFPSQFTMNYGIYALFLKETLIFLLRLCQQRGPTHI